MVTKDSNTVLDDINDLDEGFGYFRPLMDEEEENSEGNLKGRRGRPPKDPAAAMSEQQKAERKAMLIASYERLRAKSS